MIVSIGRRGALGIGIEGTPGQTTTLTHWISFLSCDLIERHTPIGDVSAKGIRDEQGGDSVEGKKWGEGGIEVILDPTTAPYWLGLAMGNISSTTSGSIEIHTITRKADNQPRTATIYRDRVVDSVKFPYSVVNTLELNFADDVAKISVDILSRYPIDEGDSPNYIDLKLFTFRNAYVELTSNGTTSELKVREFTLNINNNAEAIYAPNNNDVDRIASKQFGISGSIVIDFETVAQRDAFKNLDKQKVVVKFTEGTSEIAIEIPQFRVDTETIATPSDDLSQETIDFIAEYDGSKTIEMVVKNGVVSYY